MNINGWHRLWILISALWISLTIPAWTLNENWPSDKHGVPHREEFLKSVLPQSALWSSELTDKNGKNLAKIAVDMPNGYTLFLIDDGHADDQGSDAMTAANSYWNAVKTKVDELQIEYILYLLSTCLMPCIAMLVVGHGVAWVRRGFTA
jgi:hypothetical protein